MTRPDAFVTIDATAAVPIDVASKVSLGARHAYRRASARVRQDWGRFRLWVENMHDDQRMQLLVLVVYGLVAIIEAISRRMS